MSVARKLTKDDREKCRILTPRFRVSYPHLFKPNAMPGTNQDPKYSVSMLFDKKMDLSSIKNVIAQAKTVRFGSRENWPKTISSPVTDGDDPKFSDKEGYEGHWVIKASCNQDQKPDVVDQSGRKRITEAAQFYPGCFARAYVYAYVWEFPKNSGRYGVGFILDHVQKLEDGPAFGGRKKAEEVFSPVEGYDADSNDAEMLSESEDLSGDDQDSF